MLPCGHGDVVWGAGSSILLQAWGTHSLPRRVQVSEPQDRRREQDLRHRPCPTLQPLSLSAEREECSHPQLPDEKTEAQRGEGAYLRAHRKREAESGQQPQPLVPRPAPSWASPPLCPAKLKLRLFKRRAHLLCTSFVPHIFLGRSSGLVRLYCEFQLGFFCPLVFLFLFCCAVQHARISVP